MATIGRRPGRNRSGFAQELYKGDRIGGVWTRFIAFSTVLPMRRRAVRGVGGAMG